MRSEHSDTLLSSLSKRLLCLPVLEIFSTAGLAMYNGVILDVRFPLVLYKKLLGLKCNPLDLMTIEVCLFKSHVNFLCVRHIISTRLKGNWLQLVWDTEQIQKMKGTLGNGLILYYTSEHERISSPPKQYTWMPFFPWVVRNLKGVHTTRRHCAMVYCKVTNFRSVPTGGAFDLTLVCTNKFSYFWRPQNKWHWNSRASKQIEIFIRY